MPGSLIDQLNSIGKQALKEIEQAKTSADVEKTRISLLGKKGALSEALRGLKDVKPAERPKIGAVANEWKQKLEAAIEAQKGKLADTEIEKKMESEWLDLSLPARRGHMGSLHPITQATRKIVEIFSRIGFEVTTGPEVETEFYNFEAVNIPADHPAREMQDTFFMGPGTVLRTQTSPVQMRTMMSQPWPVRILCPGAVYRKDHDATHSPMFHQVEGLWVDRGVRMSDLKGVLEYFLKDLFGNKVQVRFRPSYFPFVEPGMEVDVRADWLRGSHWLEILGAGMVHPSLFKTAGYKADEVTGFAFGLGVERIAMLLHQIPDLRHMYQGDVRFLRQF